MTDPSSHHFPSIHTELLVPVFARAIRNTADLHWTAAVAELGAMLEVRGLFM